MLLLILVHVLALSFALAAPLASTTSALNPFVSSSPQSTIKVESNGYVYVANGNLTQGETSPYTPYGGLNTNGTLPVYAPLSDFDYQSLALTLYQEYIELDLFHYGLATFSIEDFKKAGLNQEAQFQI